VSINARTNEVTIGQEQDLERSACLVRGINWLSIQPPSQILRAEVKIRYRSPVALASIEPLAGATAARVLFDTPQRAVTPGQAAVFYDGAVCLGGGWIDQSI
jgi:tRNA-specific 2-thiouridylase